MKILKWVGIALAVVVAIVFFAARQGAQEQQRMRVALQMTSNYVGMTEGELHGLGDRLSKETKGTIGQAREVVFWMVCSGQFSRNTIEPSGKAALDLVTVKGMSEKEAVATLIAIVDPKLTDPFLACPK